MKENITIEEQKKRIESGELTQLSNIIKKTNAKISDTDENELKNFFYFSKQIIDLVKNSEYNSVLTDCFILKIRKLILQEEKELNEIIHKNEWINFTSIVNKYFELNAYGNLKQGNNLFEANLENHFNKSNLPKHNKIVDEKTNHKLNNFLNNLKTKSKKEKAIKNRIEKTFIKKDNETSIELSSYDFFYIILNTKYYHENKFYKDFLNIVFEDEEFYLTIRYFIYHISCFIKEMNTLCKAVLNIEGVKIE